MLLQRGGQSCVVDRLNNSRMRPWQVAICFASHNRDNIRLGAFRVEVIRQTCPGGLRKQMA
jgi:hypothetical protein